MANLVHECRGIFRRVHIDNDLPPVTIRKCAQGKLRSSTMRMPSVQKFEEIKVSAVAQYRYDWYAVPTLIVHPCTGCKTLTQSIPNHWQFLTILSHSAITCA